MQEVLILAAGRGRRLRPLTDSTPKSLLQVGGKPLLAHHLERLAAQGFGEVVINLAWLGEQIRACIGDGRRFGLRIRYSEETEGALGTGGGIVNALKLLGGESFLVINADILSDYPYTRLTAPADADMRLVLTPNPPHHPRGDFALARGRLVADDGDENNKDRRYTYTGIGCFRRRAFATLPEGRFSLRPIIEHAMAEGRAAGEVYRGRWLDVGTPERLEAARRLFG